MQTSVETTVGKTKRKLKIQGNGATSFKRQWPLYLLMIVPILFFVIFKYIPMLGVVVAFKDYNIFKGIWASEWVGLEVFKEVFSMPQFYRALRNTLMLNVFALLTFPIPILLAIMLNELRINWFKRVSQTMLYLPHFISWVIVGGMATRLLATNTGSINEFIKGLGLQPIPFLENQALWIMSYVGVGIWHYAGWGTILYLAALTSINKELYEAADVDGGSRLRKIWHITLPGIKPTIIVLFILQIGRMADIGFEQPFAMQNTYVMDVAQVISTYVYTVGIQSAQFAVATAVGLFQSIVGLILLLSAEFISRKINNQGIF